MIEYDPEKSKLGYYQIGDLKFYSKLEAIEVHTKTGHHPHWNFHDATFSSYKWNVEPKESILELYRQRAQQIRDQYDYVVLMYSAGADSQTALEAFIDNDIELDEVCSLINYQAAGTKNNYLNDEIFNLAIPLAKEAQLRQPNLKHRIFDISDAILNFHLDHDDDWIYYTNNMYAPNNVIRQRLHKHIPDWQKIAESGKRIAVIYGVDRPRVRHIKGHYYFHFLDSLLSNSCIHASDANITGELFYWTPDLPEICIKQGQLIRQYLESRSDVENLAHVSLTQSDLAYREVNGVKYWLSRDGVQQLIYPRLHPEIIKPPSSPSTIYGNRDTWFWKSGTFDALTYWQQGIDRMLASVSDYWLKDQQNPLKGIKGSVSRDYFLG
jgi:hypothetical protein